MIKKLTICIGCLLIVLFAACQKESDVNTAEGRTSVNVVIDLGQKAKSRYVDASQHEGIKTLRIVVSTGPKSIVYNKKYTASELTPDADGKVTLTIPDVPIGIATFFAIGNEESIGKEYTTEVILDELEKGNQQFLFVDETKTYFPKTGPNIVDHGLPMSATVGVSVVRNMAPVNIELRRAVVKLNLIVENGTTSDITLEKVNFGPFVGDRFYLFTDQTMDVPDGTQYGVLEFLDRHITIPGNQSTPKLATYIYPTYAYKAGMGDNPYTIGLTTNVREYEPLVFGMGYNSFPRNTQVNITARITTTAVIILNFEVCKWDEYPVEVPPFE